jgi:hypothetical protein
MGPFCTTFWETHGLSRGWYSTGPQPEEADKALHKKIQEARQGAMELFYISWVLPNPSTMQAHLAEIALEFPGCVMMCLKCLIQCLAGHGQDQDARGAKV